ncbi:MAG: septum formation initiator family protein [Bacteroidota bacterium]
MSRRQTASGSRFRRGLLLLGLAVAAVWFAFFDSHSLVQRVRYYAEAQALAAENTRLQEANRALERDLDAGLSDEVVEQVAREQYGMRRPGETVYPVKESEDRE